jgi:phosphatidylserine/phosphatidylglycerophosphate/cardiolipin synthase-like enzyme
MRRLHGFLLFIVLVICTIIIALIIMTLLEPVIVEEHNAVPPRVFFCPSYDCIGELVNLTAGGGTIHCAFYDLDVPELIATLAEAQAKVVIDYEGNSPLLEPLDVRVSIPNHQMHNKFCIINATTIVTGSLNPTVRGAAENRNNLLIIRSQALAENYEAEFEELWRGVYGDGEPVKHPSVLLDGNLVQNYFCPDDCDPRIYARLIDNAASSVHFLTYSFTDDRVGDALVRAHVRGVEVSGMFEKSQISDYSEFDTLKEAGIDVREDTLPGLLHHKVFIIDSQIVITGSANPTSNGFTRNDENIIIIDDPALALEFEHEYTELMAHS